MLPELGFLSLLFATTAALLLSIVPQIGIWRNKPTLTNTAWGLSYCFGIFTSVSIGILAYSFATDDFTLEYVAAHSNSQLPTFFKVAATWGGHEGSILFWLFTLSLWLVAFAFFSRKNDRTFSAQTLSLIGLICLGFAIFILFYSNPFGRAFPAPAEGRDLNPMLQDIGLIFHPPLLYVGYVGFAVNFAMSISALIFNRSAQAIARAIHSLMVTEKQGMFSYWTTLFSLLAFAFSVLGTFIVRSGALTSVHAFSLDSSRGYVLLLIFFLLTVGSLSLFALRTNTNESAVKFPLISKTGAILGLNIVLAVATVSTFLGTFYPMLFQAMNWGSISVGAPYFNSIFLPLLTLVLFAMAATLCLSWFKSDKKRFFKRLLLLIPAAVIAYGMIWNALQNDDALRFHVFAYVLLTLAIWVLFVTLWQNWAKVRLSYFGMILAHCGVAIATMGAVMSSYFGSELGVRLAPQQSQQLGQFEFHYDRFSNEIGPNFTAEVAFFNVSKQGKPYAEIVPERRYYDVRTMTMSEVGLDAGLWGDLYIVMGDNLGKGEFTFRLHYKPLIRWLWLGGILMALGALCSAINLKRKRDE